jgi:parallel beta-helix repeat protein
MKISNLIILCFVFSLISISLISKVGTGKEGNTLYVGRTEEYHNIQDAINASISRDTIFVNNGTYFENIYINKSITLTGENKRNTIIDGMFKDDAIKINANEVNISNFTIQNGLDSCINITNYTFNHFEIINPGVLPYGNYIFQNIIKNSITGIYVSGSSYNKIFNNTISNNSNFGISIYELRPRDIYNNPPPSSRIYTPSLCNLIYHNNFINNTINAYDEESNNWSYNKEGNFYDNYTGLDKNNDGIGDIPYPIAGGDNVDDYPLMMPYTGGELRLKEFYVDYDLVFMMLTIGVIVVIIFLIPIAYYWYKKNKI